MASLLLVILAITSLSALVSIITIVNPGHEYVPPGYYLDKILVRIASDPYYAASLIVNNSLHVYLEPIDLNTYSDLKTRYPELGFVRVDMEDLYMIINPSINKNLRSLLASSIDRDNLNEETFNGMGRLFTTIPIHNNPLRAVIEDLENLRLSEAISNTNSSVITVYYYRSQKYADIVADYLARHLASKGLNVIKHGVEDPEDLESAEWHILLVGIDAWETAGNILDRITSIYRSPMIPRNVVGNRDFMEIRSCWDKIAGYNYINFISDIRSCVRLLLERIIVIGLITIPGFQIYSKNDISNAIIDPDLGLLNYLFFRTAQLKDYPIWGGTLIVGVSDVNYTINPLSRQGTLNRLLQILIYDWSSFPEPLTKLPIYDQAIPRYNSESLFNDFLGPYRQCLLHDLAKNAGHPEGVTRVAMKLAPFHDGSVLDQKDLDAWIALAKRLNSLGGLYIDDLRRSENPLEARIAGDPVVVKELRADGDIIRRYISRDALYRVEGSSMDCLRISKYVFFPLQPWEVSEVVRLFIDRYGYMPDYIRNRAELRELALSIDRSSDRGIAERMERLINWIDRTSSILIGNGPFYVEKIYWRGDSIRSIALNAYRHENTYWGTSGDLDRISSIYMWRISNISILPQGTRLSICLKMAGMDETAKIFIENGILRTDLIVITTMEGSEGIYVASFSSKNACIDIGFEKLLKSKIRVIAMNIYGEVFEKQIAPTSYRTLKDPLYGINSTLFIALIPIVAIALIVLLALKRAKKNR